MRTISSLLICCLVMLTGSALGQDVFEQIIKYNKANQLDSSYALFDKYEIEFRNEEKWDSLVHLLNQKASTFTRGKTMEEIDEVLETVQKVASNKLEKHHPYYLEYIHQRSRHYTNAGKLSEAINGFDSIITITKDHPDSLHFRELALVGKAFVQLNKYEVKKSMSTALEALETLPDINDTFALTQAYQVLAIGNNFFLNTKESLKYNLLNVELAKGKFGNKHPNVGITYDQIGSTYREVGQLNEALKYYTLAKDILYNHYKQTGVGRYFSANIFNLGILYHVLGESKLAFENLDLATKIDIAELGEGNYNIFYNYNALTEIFLQTGDYQKAKNYNDKALSLIRNHPDGSEYNIQYAKSYLAEIEYNQGLYNESLNRSLALYDYFSNFEEGSPKDLIHITNALYLNYEKLGDIENATKFAQKEAELSKAYYSEIHSEHLLSLSNLLSLAVATNDKLKIYDIKNEILEKRNNGSKEKLFRNCIPSKRMLDVCATWATYLGSKMNNSIADKEEYFDYLEDFEAYFELHLSGIRSNAGISQSANMLKEIYSPAIRYENENNLEKAIIYVEKIKSFLTRMILQNQLIHKGSDEGLTTNKLYSALQNQQDSLNVDVYIEVIDAIEELQQHKDSLFAADIISYRKQFGMKNIESEDLWKSLLEDELIIEYIKLDTVLLAIFSDGKNHESFEINFNKIDSLVTEHLTKRSKGTANKLYHLLLPTKLVNKYEKWLILPDDKLYFINFEELLNENDEYLVFNKTIRYAYSAIVLNQQSELSKQHNNSNSILGVTPGFSAQLKEKYIAQNENVDSSWLQYLQQPFLVRLANELSQFSKSESLISSDATEFGYKEKVEDFRILHLGTHGILNNQSPMFSKLIFAKDSIEDGYLHTYEIFGQNLNADLAVLSACNSGSGTLVSGEGVLSMAHAFTHAGCPSVLMTKWDVDEKSTSTILNYFYKNLREGKSKSEALRDAKLTFLENSPAVLHDPYYWAGLVLIGDDSAMYSGSWYRSPFGITFIIFFVLILVFVFFRNRKILH